MPDRPALRSPDSLSVCTTEVQIERRAASLPCHESIKRAAAKLTGRSRVRYNLALALTQLGRMDEAAAALEAANRLDSGDPAILEALVMNGMGRQRWHDAERHAKQLLRVAPDSRVGRQVLQRVQVLRAQGIIR